MSTADLASLAKFSTPSGPTSGDDEGDHEFRTLPGDSNKETNGVKPTKRKDIGYIKARVEQGIPDAESHTALDRYTLSELKALDAIGYPVFYDHIEEHGPIGRITNKWVDEERWMWIEADLFLTHPLMRDIEGAITAKDFKKFTVGPEAKRRISEVSGGYSYDSVTDPVTGKRVPFVDKKTGRVRKRFREVSVTEAGKRPGAYIEARASLTAENGGTDGTTTSSSTATGEKRHLQTDATSGELYYFGLEDIVMKETAAAALNAAATHGTSWLSLFRCGLLE